VWVFVWLMFALKIPILGLYLIVRWAIRQTPEAETGSDGGPGVRVQAAPVHPRPRLPRKPRRGPHADPPPAAPARVRAVARRLAPKRATPLR
jgi:hypothetical protein